LVQKCKVTLKRLEKLPVARNADRVIKLRIEKIEEWEAMPNLGFTKPCVFIDEAGFNLHTQRNFGWRSLRSTPAKGTVPTARGVTVSILGAISEACVIDISLKKPQDAPVAKKEENKLESCDGDKQKSWNKNRTLPSMFVQRYGYIG
jgi:hypothetical protein